VPGTKGAASEHSQTTASANSSGPPQAPDGLGREVELLARWQFCDDLFDPWGTEDAWAEGVDADILLREFERGGLGQADDRYRTLFLVSE
jgi:hypothetical protein